MKRFEKPLSIAEMDAKALLEDAIWRASSVTSELETMPKCKECGLFVEPTHFDYRGLILCAYCAMDAMINEEEN